MESWRHFFAAAGVDLWIVCERALALAYLNDVEGFPANRDRLAQKLYAPEKLDFQVCEVCTPQLTGSNGGSRRDIGSVEDCRQTTDGTYDEADALTEEMDEEILLKRDVLDIKETLQDSYQSEREIYNLLRRLELMHLTFNVLKDTEIGKVVNSLRKHSSTRVVALAKQLVRGWKDFVQVCCKSALDVAAAATAERADTAGSGSLVVDGEEHGLPFPPMDEAALLEAPTASVEMLQSISNMKERRLVAVYFRQDEEKTRE